MFKPVCIIQKLYTVYQLKIALVHLYVYMSFILTTLVSTSDDTRCLSISCNLHTFALYTNYVQSQKRKYTTVRKANFACSRKRRIGVAGAIRSEIRRNFAAKPLSESARFKIYQRRVIFAIPTRRSRGVCYSSENAESAGRSQKRASCINTLGRSAAAAVVNE